MIHASAKTDHPVKQGLMGAFEVFADTIVVCSMTGLVVIATGYWNSGLQGSELTLTAFESGMGSVARALIAISIFLFGLTTSTGWFTYYSVILKHWLKNNQKVLKIAEKVFILGTPLWGSSGHSAYSLRKRNTGTAVGNCRLYNRIPYICECCHIVYLKWYLL